MLAACLGHLEKSAVAEHAWQEGHTINWSGVHIQYWMKLLGTLSC